MTLTVESARGPIDIDDDTMRKVVQAIYGQKHKYEEAKGYSRLFVAGYQQALAELKGLIEEQRIKDPDCSP